MHAIRIEYSSLANTVGFEDSHLDAFRTLHSMRIHVSQKALDDFESTINSSTGPTGSLFDKVSDGVLPCHSFVDLTLQRVLGARS